MDTVTPLNIKIVRAPDKRLRVQTKPVKKITPELLRVTSEMIKLAKTFQDPEGVGLASTQVGRDEQMFVGKLDGKNFETVFNPQIISCGKRIKTFFEGCLSIPEHYGEIQRPTNLTVTYINKEGQKITKRLIGLASWIFQHEMDHLQGKLFVDHVLEQKGKMFKAVGKDKSGADIFEEVALG